MKLHALATPLLTLPLFGLATLASPQDPGPPNAGPPTPGGQRPPGLDGAPGPSTRVATTARTRPPAPPSDAQALASASNDLGLRLFRDAALAGDDDLALSPASLHAALLMTWVGSRGETRAAFDRVLGLAELEGWDDARVNAAAEALLEQLALEGTGEAEGDHMRFANALWGQHDRPFVEATLDLLSRYHGAPLHGVDWRGATEAARKEVNDWVERRTEGRIRELVPADAVSEETGLVLTSALHFVSAWDHAFQERWTRDLGFHLESGEVVQAPFLVGRAHHGYGRAGDVQVLTMGLRLGGYQMVVLLPDDAKAMDALLEALDDAHLASLLASVAYAEVQVELPRSRVESSFRLGESLKALGLAPAFVRGADLSGFDGTRDLQVNEVLQKTFLELDEEGVEAAAATAMVMRVGAAVNPQFHTFRADRPHLLLLREARTGQVVMAARVADPR